MFIRSFFALPKNEPKKATPITHFILLNLFAKTFKLATLKQKSFLRKLALNKN
jgi:hypothetical protein